MRRVPQPPVDASLRELERHSFWPGFVVVVVGVVLVFCGGRNLTGVETVQGGNAWETQLVRAFAFGGLQFADQLMPPSPPPEDNPEAMERWLRENRSGEAPTWRVRVDTEARTPCPT